MPGTPPADPKISRDVFTNGIDAQGIAIARYVSRLGDELED